MADKFAIITGASTGIGFELATLAAKDGYDILVIADEPLIEAAAADFKQFGTDVQSVEADLSSIEGVETLLAATNGRQIDVLCANAGWSLGKAFLDQPVEAWTRTIGTNITGTLHLLQKTLTQMKARGDGKVLVTGSIVGFIPGTFNPVYNATKAFIDNFTEAVRNELKEDKGVTLTTLLPGATDTEFFARADMEDTAVGQAKKDDPERVAKDGWEAMMAGKSRITSGWYNKVQVAMSGVVPQPILAEMHRHMAEPGSGTK